MFRHRTTILTLAVTMLAALLVPVSAGAVDARIVVGEHAPAMEVYAARELQRYLYELSGSLVPITDDGAPLAGRTFVVGQPSTNRIVKAMVDSGTLQVSPSQPGPDGYALKKAMIGGAEVLAVAGSDEQGTLYGVYGLLDDHYGVGFYMGGDVLPAKRTALSMPDVDESVSPRQRIRGFLPWTNFPQSATSYSFSDYKAIIDQMTKMRMNLLEIHNYNGMGSHNEMFHDFTYKGITSRVFMASARTGHLWAGPGWQVKDYLFGAGDLFDDYDFGADCTLHNKSLSNEEAFRKGSTLFREVIEYAHSRGVKIGLGIELDLIPSAYGAKPNDPEIVNARIDQIIHDYPSLDYLLCYRSEIIGQESAGMWNGIFDTFYRRFKAEAPRTRLAVSGWGLSAEHVAHLPQDVIAAPIAPYTASCESGSIYPGREYWGCPWLERDFNSSVHYYPYNMHLSDTVKAYHDRAANMTGFMCLTWRLTDAVDAKMSYIAKAPWDVRNRLDSSRAVYYDYAVKNYGRRVASTITDIIDQNEPYAVNASECEGTPEFAGKDRSVDIAKADSQLATIDRCIAATDDPGARFRLGLLKSRIAAVRAYCLLDQSFPKSTWDDLPGEFDTWARAFRDRVTDISSLGNVVSSQNRLVQLRYVAKEEALRKAQAVKSPSHVEASGTRSGAVITWRNEEKDARGLNVYRDAVKLNRVLLSSSAERFVDTIDGRSRYSVTSVSKAGQESPRSVPATCASGSADTIAPNVVAVSPPTSALKDHPVDITARLLDDRAYDSLSAELRYRPIGHGDWMRIPMRRRVRAVFAARIPASEVGESGLEWYIAASDGTNEGFYPKAAPEVTASIVCSGAISRILASTPVRLSADGQSLRWTPGSSGVLWYRIYRSRERGFTPGPENLLTYVAGESLKFADMEPGFDGLQLQGRYWYRVTVVDGSLGESPASNAVSLVQPTITTGAGAIEAESAELNGVQTYSDPGASDSSAVGYFGEAAGDSIAFRGLPKSKRFTITYANTGPETKQCSLYLNGKDAATLRFESTESWYAYRKLTVDLPISGDLMLRVDEDDLAANKTFCANIDCIELGERDR